MSLVSTPACRWLLQDRLGKARKDEQRLEDKKETRQFPGTQRVCELRPEQSPRESKLLPPEGQGQDCQGKRMEACSQGYDSSGRRDCPIREPSSHLWTPPMALGSLKAHIHTVRKAVDVQILFKILLFPL